MKKQYIIILIVMIVMAIILTIFKPKDKTIESPVSNLPQNTKDLIVPDTYESRNLSINDDYINFDVKYPYFKNAPLGFNDSILDLLNKEIADNKQTAKDNWNARYETQEKGDNISKVPSQDEKFSFYSDFTIVQSNSYYISFVLNYGGFTGGAHGYEMNTTFNYDLKNNKVLTLADMFSSDTNYLKYLSDEARKYLTAKYAVVSEEDKNNSNPEIIKEYIDNMISGINQGTEPKEENFANFTFTPEKVKIYFADYQVGPHSNGMPEVEVERK